MLRRTRYKILLIACVVLMSGVGGVLAWLMHDLPSIDDLERGLALPSTRIFDRNGKLLYEILPPEQGRNTFIALADVPPHCVNAVIAVEDANFYTHPGVDPVGIARALWINLQGGEVLAGGSTITQQLVRTVLLDPEQRAERTLERKLKEAILALQLQSRYSKDDVLELYLNQVYFGNLAYGIEGAARAYFAKSATTLSLAECALLAGMIQNPALHDPLTRPESAKARQAVALGLLRDAGKISAQQAQSAADDALQFASTRFPIQAPHFVMAVWRQLERQFPDTLYRRGLDVVTTLDLDWHNSAQSITRRHLEFLNDPIDGGVPANAYNAALVALDPHTGEVLTLLGSPDYFNEQISGAVNAALALRQPGSALKPFTYAAALNPARGAEAWTPATLMMDVQTGFVTRRLESYIPSNYGFIEHGPVLVREALAGSYNIPAVLTLENVGVQAMVQLAASAGLVSLLDHPELDLAVTLGGGEVRLLELTQAYSVFVNGGYRVEPVMIRTVTDRATGETLYTWQPPALTERVVSEQVAYLITDILSDPLARLRSFGRVSALDIGRPSAAKTGTTTDFRDNWIAGYTPDLVVGVWVGNANNTPMRDVTGVSGAAPIWNNFMRSALQNTPARAFTRPEGLVEVEICALSGRLPTPDCPSRRVELFIAGTQPTLPDHLYQGFEVDVLTGALADDTTPPERRRREVYIVLPQEARAWGERNGIRPPPESLPVTPTDASDTLRILTPAPHLLYQVSPTAPRETQRLRFSVSAPRGTRAITYALNGETFATVESPPFEAWWVLETGDYTLTATATLADGSQVTGAAHPFRVVEYLPFGERNERLNSPP